MKEGVFDHPFCFCLSIFVIVVGASGTSLSVFTGYIVDWTERLEAYMYDTL